MSRAFLALVLLAAPLVLAPLGDAAAPPGYSIPTQQDAPVGGLNATLWVMRDTRTISYTPDVRTNPLSYLWNLNFTAGSLGVLYVKGEAREPGPYRFEARVTSASPLLTVLQPFSAGTNTTSAASAACGPLGANGIRCNLTDERRSGDYAFQFNVAGSTPPGPLPVNVEVASFVGDSPTPEARHNFTYTLSIIDPLPPYAIRAETRHNTTVAAWVNGGPLSFGGQGCLAGAALGRNESLVQGAAGVVCFLGIARGEDEVRLVGRVVPPGTWMIAPPTPWTSHPFNATTGGANAPVNGFPISTNGLGPLGAQTLTVAWTLERNASGTWEPVESGELLVPFTLVADAGVIAKGKPVINWLATGPLLLAAVAGLGYLASKNRRPKIQPRSQALRSELARKTGRGRAGEVKASADSASVAEQLQATPEEVAQQRQEVQEAAWEKKRKILEAKREDILKSIRIAEERHQRGEITEHVLKGIRERKERQLEQVQNEMESLQE